MIRDADRRVLHLDRLSSDALSSIFARIELSGARDVHGRYELLACDDMMFVRATTVGGTFHVNRRSSHLKGDACDAFFLCLPLSGGAMLSQHGRACALDPGDFGMLDAQSPYAIEISGGCDALWIRLPRSRLDWSSRTIRTLSARRVDGASGVGLLVSRYIRTLFEEMPSVPGPSRSPLAAALVDLVSEAASVVTRVVRPFKPSGRKTLERARIFIERNLGDEDLTPARIAAGVGISQRYLSELFAGEGITTMRHVTARRLERCREALGQETWQPGVITQLAFANGFVNLSSFNRLFKQTYGATPRQVMIGIDGGADGH